MQLEKNYNLKIITDMNCCQLACRVLPLTILLVALSLCGHESTEKDKSPSEVRVKTITVANNGVEEKYSYSGTVEEESGTVVSFSAAGTIKTLTITEGQTVSKGQLIGTLDDGSLKNAYDIAIATLDQAKDAYKRMKLLHDANSLPDIKWVDVQSKLKQAESAAEIARIALDDAKLHAPVSGVVSEKMASVGQTVAPGIPVAKIVDIHSVKVSISVPENEISRFANGDVATITTKAAPGETYSGRLVEKGVAANPLSRSYLVKYQVENSGNKLLPGMICEVATDNVTTSDGVILPVSAVLLTADNCNFVWLDSAGVARKRIVRPGAMLPEGIMIESGLNGGDKVIVAGTEKVSQGTKVTSIN